MPAGVEIRGHTAIIIWAARSGACGGTLTISLLYHDLEFEGEVEVVRG